jgi:hypothetical protein
LSDPTTAVFVEVGIMPNSTVGTVRVNLRVPERVKESFEATVVENRPEKASRYASVLEDELLAEFGIGEPGTLVDAVHSLARTHEETDRDKKIPPVPESDEDAHVQYRIGEGIRDRLVNAAESDDTVDTAGEYLAKIMWRYAEGDGYKSRAAARAGRVEDATRAYKSDTKTEGYIQSITDAVGDGTQFTFSEFREAFDKYHGGATAGTGTPSKTEKEYLDRVLDRLGYEWHPGGFFADPDAVDVPEHPDPTAKPYHFMDESDKRLAVKYAALDRARQSYNGWAKFDHAEAKATLDSRPDSATGFMQQIGECDGFSYDRTEEVLKVNADRALDAAENREAVAALVDDTGETTANDHVEGGGSTGETTTPDADLVDEPDLTEDSDSAATVERATDDDGDGWIPEVLAEFKPDAQTVADKLPDRALRAKIARYRYGEGDDGYAKGTEKVPDSDVTAVRTYAEGMAVPDSSDDAPEDTADLEADAKAELDALAAGTPANATVATDGGSDDDDDAGGDDTPPLRPDGGTATADTGTTLGAGRTADTLECRSLGRGPCCPACGGQLRETDHRLTVECIRSRCGRRVSLVDVADQVAGTGPPPEPGD